MLATLSGRITALEEQKDPQRRSLFIDGEFAMGLDLESVVRCSLRVGQEIDGPALVKAYEIDQSKRAWEKALSLLALTPRTVKEIGQRLSQSYPPAVIDPVLDRLVAAGWLDDRTYAQSYIRARREYGARRLLADLIRRGVNRELGAQAVEEALGKVDAAEQAREVAARRLAKMGEVDRQTAQRRLVSYLARRGFGPEAISRALDPLLAELPQAERRQGNREGWRRVEANAGKEMGRGSSLRRTSSLQRRKPFGSHDEEE